MFICGVLFARALVKFEGSCGPTPSPLRGWLLRSYRLWTSNLRVVYSTVLVQTQRYLFFWKHFQLPRIAIPPTSYADSFTQTANKALPT